MMGLVVFGVRAQHRPHTADSSLPSIADRARAMKHALQRGGFAAQSMESRQVWDDARGRS